MNINNNKVLKTLGPLAGYLVATLYSYNRPIFHFQESAEILGGHAPASKVLSQLITNGVVTRLSGLKKVILINL